MWRYRVPVSDFLALRDDPTLAAGWHGKPRFEGPGTLYGIIECNELLDAFIVITLAGKVEDLPERVVWP